MENTIDTLMQPKPRRLKSDGTPWGKTGPAKGEKKGKGDATAHSGGILEAMNIARSIMRDQGATESARVSALKAYTDLHARYEAGLATADVPLELDKFIAEVYKG